VLVLVRVLVMVMVMRDGISLMEEKVERIVCDSWCCFSHSVDSSDGDFVSRTNWLHLYL
jgi:hypothetical protein